MVHIKGYSNYTTTQKCLVIVHYRAGVRW